MDLRNVIEAIVFVSEQPVTVEFILQVLEKAEQESAEVLPSEKEGEITSEQI